MAQIVSQSLLPPVGVATTQDQENVSTEVQEILRKKPIMLNFPGSRVIGSNLYYDDVKMDLVETLSLWGRYKVSLNSTRFSSTAHASIPSQALLGYVILHLVLPEYTINERLGAAPNNSITDAIACNSSWGINCIQQMEVRFGGGQAYQISGDSVYHFLVGQNSYERSSELINVFAGESFATGETSDTVSTTVPAQHAFVIIPTPFSGDGTHAKKKFDMSSLNQELTLYFTFKPLNQIVGGPGVNTSKAYNPAGFDIAEIIVNQTEYMGK